MDQALKSYDMVLEVYAAYAQALNNKMHVLQDLGKQKEAMQIFSKMWDNK